MKNPLIIPNREAINILAESVFKTFRPLDPRPALSLPLEALQSLYRAFAMDCSDEEACVKSGVAYSSFLNQLATEEGKQIADAIPFLRRIPAIVARDTLTSNLNDPEIARWYVERKIPKEFSPKASLDITTAGESLNSIAKLLDTLDKGAGLEKVST